MIETTQVVGVMGAFCPAKEPPVLADVPRHAPNSGASWPEFGARGLDFGAGIVPRETMREPSTCALASGVIIFAPNAPFAPLFWKYA